MSSIGQLDLFSRQPQVIRYDLAGTTYNRFTGDDSVQPGNESDQFSLHNDRGDVLVSLPGQRKRLVADQVRHRLLLEIAFSQGQSLAGLSLPGLTLAQVHLAGVKRIDLTNAVLPNATVTGGRLWADLRGSKLNNLVASQVDWHGCQLADCQLTGASITASNLQSISFRRSNLRKAHLQDCQLRMSDLSFCQLHQANLQGSDLSGCDLRHADLSGCDLRGTYLKGISVSIDALQNASLTPIRQRIHHLVQAYPLLKPAWITVLENGNWQAGSSISLSDFLSTCLGCRVGAGWQNVRGSTEWIIWQYIRSIQSREWPSSHPLAGLLYKWVTL